MFTNVFRVLISGELFVGSVWLHEPELPIIDIQTSIIGHCPKETGLDYTYGLNRIEILREDILLGKGEGELREVQDFICHW